MVGNFPQAFSHLALVSAATKLEQVATGRHRVPTRPGVSRS
jgi:GH15 family glucan-1,4-alpha-glucosidase